MLLRRLARSPLAPRGARLLADAVTPYRQLVGATAVQRDEWAVADTVLHSRMREHVVSAATRSPTDPPTDPPTRAPHHSSQPAALAHNGEEAFDNHLVGVQSVLRSWGASEKLCNAALFHSIYGTEGFQGFKLPLSKRDEIAQLIGPEAERLAWIFCMVDRASVDETVLRPPPPPGAPPAFRARIELGAFAMPLADETEWLDFVTLSLADWLEQVEGAARHPNPAALWGAGEAWAYRRDAYAAMARLLGDRGVDAAPVMYAEVFAREPEASRVLVQPLTPPMSDAAREAYEALESSRWSSTRGGGGGGGGDEVHGASGVNAALGEMAWKPMAR